MAILSDDEVKLRISTETTGGAAVEQLAQHIDELAKQGGQAAPALGVLANNLRKLSSDAEQYNATVDETARRTKNLGGQVQDMALQLAKAAAALQAGQAFISANSQVESLSRTLGILTDNSKNAASEMEYIRDAAQRLGLDVLETGKAYTSLLASTKGTALEGAAARQVFEAVAGAMATLGKTSAETSNALLAVNQMASKGTVSMEELKGQLGEALPGAMKAAANGAGLTVAELTKMVESGSVLAEDLLPALGKGLTEMYGVGKANNDTFVAQWARMKNAVTDLFTVVGESGVMKVLNEGLALTTFGAKGLVVGFDALIGKTKELFGGSQWDSEKARKSLEDVAKNSALLSKALDDASAASSRMGSIIREESNSALQLQSAFDQANDNLGKQITNLEKVAAARKTEADTAARAGQLYDTEIQQRRSAITAAEAHEAALVRVAEQTRFSVTLKETELAKEKVMAEQGRKQTQDQIAMTEERIKALEREAEARGTSTQRQKEEVAGLESYLAALKAELLGMGGESEARKKKIEEIEKEIEKRAALADKAQQEAAAAHVATQAAELAAATYADNSKRVGELRAAYEAATVAFERTGEAFVKGIATDKELTASKEAAQRALVLYRDALSDATAAAERHVAAEKSAASIQQSALQNDLYRANTILEVAKQRGNEKEIAQAQIAVWRIELEISEAQAVAARKEAEAMEIVTKAKRAELEASGGLTEAKKAELALAEAQARAKELEAEKYDLVADRMRKLSYETRGLESSFGDLSSSADQAAASADRAASSYDGLASSIRAAGQAKDGFVRNTNGEIVTTGPNVAELAAKNTQTPEQARVFEEVFNYYYQKASQDPSNYSTMQGLQFGSIERAATAAAAAEAQRRTVDTASSNQTAVNTMNRSTSQPVTMNINLGNLGTRTLKLDGQANAEAVVGFLTELARTM
jgi:tape measure domain-containing protein